MTSEPFGTFGRGAVGPGRGSTDNAPSGAADTSLPLAASFVSPHLSARGIARTAPSHAGATTARAHEMKELIRD